MTKRQYEPTNLRKGQIVKVRIASLAGGGEGVSKDHGIPIFVARVAAGDLAEIELFDVRKDFARGRLVGLVEPAADRVEPPCKLFKVCGGCQWQHLSYPAQLQAKEDIVRQAVKHIGGIDPAVVSPCLPAEEALYYRNKAQFPVAQPRGSQRILAGYYRQDSHELVNVKHCPVQPGAMDRVLEAAKEVMEEQGFSAYDESTGQGFLRHIAVRYSFAADRLLVTFVVNDLPSRFPEFKVVGAGEDDQSVAEDDPALGSPTGRRPERRRERADMPPDDGDAPASSAAVRPRSERLLLAARALTGLVPEVAGVCVNFNNQAGNRIMGASTALVCGQDQIVETLASRRPDQPEALQRGIRFRLSPTSFFQIHSHQAVRLLEAVAEAVGPERRLVVDAFAGVGTMSLWLAAGCGKVIAIEEHRSAVADGESNLDLNGIDNVEFRAGRVEDVIPALIAEALSPEVVVVDPPRKGVSAEALEAIIGLGVSRIVYVSCNPATLARDLKILERNGYKTKQIQPVDMFPQTFHVETVTVLDRVN